MAFACASSGSASSNLSAEDASTPPGARPAESCAPLTDCRPRRNPRLDPRSASSQSRWRSASLKPLLDSLAHEIEHIGNFPSLFLGTVTPEGALEYYDGLIRIVDAEGNIVADGLGPAALRLLHRRGQRRVVLHEVSRTTNRSAIPGARIAWDHWRASTWPVGGYAARRPRTQRIQAARTEGAVCQSFYYHLARLIEMLHCVERIEELANDPELLREHVRAKAGQNRNQGSAHARRRAGCSFTTTRSMTTA